MLDAIPHIQQYDGTWSIYGPSASTFWLSAKAKLQNFDSRIDEGEYAYSGQGYEVTPEGIAVVDLEGVLTKYGSSLCRTGSTVRFRQVLRRVESAYRAGDVKACLLCIESGGGSTMGTPEAAEEVKYLSSVMPVWTFFEDIGASAAFWIGSQAGRVLANESALIGSIGTYFVIHDLSGMFEKDGVSTFLATTGKHKGAGTPGTELTDEHKAEFQSLVERINAPFPQAIAEARGLSDEQINEVNDGRVWRGDEAVAKGLIDDVMSYDEALAELASSLETSNNGDTTMAKPRASSTGNPTKPKSEEPKKNDEVESEEVEEETTAEEDQVEEIESMDEEEEDRPSSAASSIAAFQKAVPDADSDFVVKAVQKGWTPDQAKMNWLEQTVKSQSEQIEKLESQSPKPGNKAVGVGKQESGFDGDAEKAWKSAIKDKTDEGMSRSEAVRSVATEQPDLHQAYIVAKNNK